MTITPTSSSPFSSLNTPLALSSSSSVPSTSDSLESSFDVRAVAIPQNMSISLLNQILGTTSVNLSQQLKQILQQDAGLTLQYFEYLAQGSSNLISLLNSGEASFISQTFDEDVTGPDIVAINNDNTAMQQALADQSNANANLVTATASYQTAIDTYNSADVSTSAKQTAALNNLNTARTTYNDAVNLYNDKVTAASVAVTKYQTAVATYSTLLTDKINPLIDKLNQTRPPLPLLTHQSVPTDTTNWSYTIGTTGTALSPATLSSAPSQDISPIDPAPTMPAPPAYALPIVDPRTLKEIDSLSAFQTAAAQFYGVTQDQLILLAKESQDHNLTGLDYIKAVRLAPQANTKDSTSLPNVAGGGPAGIAAAMLTFRVSSAAAQAVLSQTLAKQAFNNERLSIPTDLHSHLLNLTLKAAVLGGQLATFPGISYLNGYLASLPPNSPAIGIAAALGYNTTQIGLLNNQGLLISIQQYLGTIPSLSDITAQQKQSIADSLTAQVSASLTRISVSTLADQLGTPSVNDTLKVAALVANPTFEGSTFATLQQKLAGLTSDYGIKAVALPLTNLLQSKLTDAGLSADQADTIANEVSTSVTTHDLSSLQNLNLGSDVSPNIQNIIFQSVVTYTAAASLKQEVQAKLISSAGPAQSLNLSDNIVKNLYGFSVDIGSGTIEAQEIATDQRPNSIIQIAADNRRTLLKTAGQNALDAANNNYTDAHKQDTSLDTFQRTLINPGMTHFGLMYKGAHGTTTERKSIDIDV